MLPLMVNLRGREGVVGLESVRYYAFVVVMAKHIAQPTREEKTLQERALDRLAKAVRRESEARAHCRDTHAEAAVKVRPWSVA